MKNFGIIATIIVIAIAAMFAVAPAEKRDPYLDWNESIFADFVFWFTNNDGQELEGKLSIILDENGETTGDVIYKYKDVATDEIVLHERASLLDYISCTNGDEMINGIVLEYKEIEDHCKGYTVQFYED